MIEQSSNSLVQRMIGAARLDVNTYEAVERDVSANTSALIVVLLAAIASGVGTLSQGVGGFVGGIIAGLIGWVLYAAVAYFIGTTLFKTGETAATLGEVLRTLGFAQSPRLLLVLGFIPILGAIVALVVAIWVIATTVVALRQAMELTTGRAIGTAIVAAIIFIIPYAILASIVT